MKRLTQELDLTDDRADLTPLIEERRHRGWGQPNVGASIQPRRHQSVDRVFLSVDSGWKYLWTMSLGSMHRSNSMSRSNMKTIAGKNLTKKVNR